ncbi:hypothetical protein KP509_1Z110300 [Ceratopteris richardii]|nr:hypothetical protein KP509_1Z110300 [Ceratopteris richardii]
MDQPLLGKRKKRKANSSLTSLLEQIWDDIPEEQPVYSSVVAPRVPNIKDKLIFGSPDASPPSQFVWVNYNVQAQEAIDEATEGNFMEHEDSSSACGSLRGGAWRQAAIKSFDDSFIDSRDIGSDYSRGRFAADLTSLDLDVKALTPRYPTAISSGIKNAFKLEDDEGLDKASHVVPIMLNIPPNETSAVSWSYARRKHFHRSRTAPAMTIMDFKDSHNSKITPLKSSSRAAPFYAVRQAFFFLLLYLAVGVAIYTWKDDEFSGSSTYNFVDAIYFCIVTLCTIGYGDITPSTTFTKLFACIFVLVGFGFIDVLLSSMVNDVLDSQEDLILNAVNSGSYETAKSYVVDIKKGRMRIRMKVALAFGVVIGCIGVGTIVTHFLETLGWLDSFYLVCMSVTTVGYGDHAFKTMAGRLFASIWLLVSTLAVARSFLYLAEARIEKRHRRFAKIILQRDMTVGDLVAADLDNNGFVRYMHIVLLSLSLHVFISPPIYVG